MPRRFNHSFYGRIWPWPFHSPCMAPRPPLSDLGATVLILMIQKCLAPCFPASCLSYPLRMCWITEDKSELVLLLTSARLIHSFDKTLSRAFLLDTGSSHCGSTPSCTCIPKNASPPKKKEPLCWLQKRMRSSPCPQGVYCHYTREESHW